jgi:metallo-beta-lactamase family protein
MKPRVRFYGAVQEVTGSMHLLEVDGQTIALDCGLYQGKRAEANVKNRNFPLEASKVDAVVLSHSHIDHCGRLPMLVAQGFSGPIYATPPTCDLTDILLADSAHIQEEDAAYWNKKRVRKGDAPIEPLYTMEDAEQTVPLLRARRIGQMFDVLPGVRATFYEAGHMLGSAGVLLEMDGDSSRPIRLVYTGDMGRPNMPILRDPAPLPECDYLLCESTYGGRMTPRPEDMRDQLAEIINTTIDHGGKLIIPSFAVGRTQVIVYYFHLLLHEKRLHRKIPVYVDSPLAVKATEVFRKHPEVYDREAKAFNHLTGDMFDCDGCQYIENVEQSKALHNDPGPMVIVSASGMCEAGRILHHLKNNVENPRNTILIVGYQAAHTLGRRLVEKEKRIRIFGETYQVRARVKVLNGFSAHANAAELAEATAPLAGAVKRAFLIHGEPDQTEALASTMSQRGFADVHVAAPDEVFELN